MNKVTVQQSKYIALHVGLFWGIGRFIIKNEDTIIIKVNDRSMVEFLSTDEKHHDDFIKDRIFFIKQLIEQRELKIKYEFVDEKENLVSLSL